MNDTPTGLIEGMSDEQYHSRPELSSTGARMLLPEFKGSPKKFQWAQTHKRVSRSFDFGHATHAEVLGVGTGIIVYPDEHLTPSGNPSTKAATVEWEAEQRSAGYTVVSPDDYERVNAMKDAVLAHPTARPLLEVVTMREVSVFADVDGVPCRARFDALSEETKNGVYGIDLKTTEDATKIGFERSVSRFGYNVQEAHYKDVYKAAVGIPVDNFFIIAAEKTAPYEVAVFQIEPFWVDIGHKKAARAREIFAECTATGEWPGYTTETQELNAPAWAVIEHEMQYDNGEINI